jgi:hypothetical protein
LRCDGQYGAWLTGVPEMVESWRLAQPLPVTAVWEYDPAWSAIRPFQWALRPDPPCPAGSTTRCCAVTGQPEANRVDAQVRVAPRSR